MVSLEMIDLKSFARSFIGKSQWLCSCLFLFCIMVGLLIVILLHLQVFPDVQDTRCKCVCPHDHHATLNRTVFVKLINSSDQCICRFIVPSADDVLCSRCQCTFETRNNFLVKFIIVSMMFLILVLMIAVVGVSVIKTRNKYYSSRNGYERIPNQTYSTQDSLNGNIQDVHRMRRRDKNQQRA